MEARLDVANDMENNGERSVQRVALSGATNGKLTIFDVGANVGEWSEAMLSAASPSDSLEIHVFEPTSATFAALSRRLGANAHVKLVNQGASDIPGRKEMIIAGSGLGTNSLHGERDKAQAVELAEFTTVDEYCKREGISAVTLLKIDTEGHDLAVLRGAKEMFGRHAIGMAQFEYNQRWIDSRSLLRDAFELLLPLGYRLGKVTPRGIEFYPQWHFELESYREANLLACTPEWAVRLPQVKWWMSS